MILNKLPGDLVAINTIDNIPATIAFTQCLVKTAQNYKQSDTWDLARLLTLKPGSKVMLSVDINIQDRLINGQMGVVKYFKTVDNADNVDKFDDPEADRKLIGVKMKVIINTKNTIYFEIFKNQILQNLLKNISTAWYSCLYFSIISCSFL